MKNIYIVEKGRLELPDGGCTIDFENKRLSYLPLKKDVEEIAYDNEYAAKRYFNLVKNECGKNDYVRFYCDCGDDDYYIIRIYVGALVKKFYGLLKNILF